jgi:hypothetical protein
MWVTDYFTRATLMMKEEEAERLRLVSDARRQAGEGKSARGWRWRIEPGMEEAFEHLQGWFLSSQREVPAEMTAPSQGAAQLGEEACLGAPDQSPLPVGWPLPACCPLRKGHRTRDADLVVAGPRVPCCAP